MIELTFLKILMLIRQINQKSIATIGIGIATICHYWYFLIKGFKFQPNAYNGYQGVLMMSMNLNDIAILNVRSIDYCCIVNRISKDGSMGLLRNSSLNQKRGTL